MASSISTLDPVPWSSRDVWLGVACVVVLIVFAQMAWFFLAPQPLAWDIAPFAAFAEPLAIPIIWFFGPKKYRVGWEALGLRRASIRSFGLGCGALVAIYIIAAINAACLISFRINYQPPAIVAVANTRFPGLLLAGGVLFAPLSEELLFRGFAFSGLQARYGWKNAALLSSLLFAVLHLQPAFTILFFAIGILLSMIYYRTNSLWPGVFVHATVNAVGLLAALLLTRLTAPA